MAARVSDLPTTSPVVDLTALHPLWCVQSEAYGGIVGEDGNTGANYSPKRGQQMGAGGQDPMDHAYEADLESSGS